MLQKLLKYYFLYEKKSIRGDSLVWTITFINVKKNSSPQWRVYLSMGMRYASAYMHICVRLLLCKNIYLCMCTYIQHRIYMHHVDTYTCLWVYVPAYAYVWYLHSFFTCYLTFISLVLSCCSRVLLISNCAAASLKFSTPSYYFFSLLFNTTVKRYTNG